jgi:serine/threonine-protein kinase RsbW
MTEKSDRVDVSAPATPQMMDLAYDAIQRLWGAHEDVAMTDRIRFETAVMEILGNIVQHAYALDESGSPETRRFDLTLTADADAVVASFGDDGVPMALDLSEIVMPDEYAESGRGLAMAMAALDDLAYERQGGRNHWRLMVQRRG